MKLVWDNLKGENDDEAVFSELEAIVNNAKEAVTKA